MIYLRNLHAKRTVHLPYAHGWSRVLRPAVTTMLPEDVLHRPPVRRLLARQLIAVVDGCDSDADARQARSGRAEWARLIAEAEQREFDRLRAGVEVRAERVRMKPNARRAAAWPAEWTERLKARWAAGATVPAIAAELGVTSNAVHARIQTEHLTRSGGQSRARRGSSKANREGLGSRNRLRAGHPGADRQA